jgi:2-C-methyl-D-erythritol 4-phosphate cytidylyltransferase/2-C-methyl-D-erythritol 2,4-cyclodiphosphate synthase
MESSPQDVGVVLVAAGGSSRMGGGRSKVWLELGGEPLLAHSLRTLDGWSELRALSVVVRSGDEPQAQALLDRVAPALAARARVVVGGAERVDSVRAGLSALPREAQLVLVHDAARPLATRELFARVAAAARAGGAAVPALAVVDTLKRVDGAGRLATVARDGLFSVQTPQGFRRELLERAHAQSDGGAAVTDDAMVVEALGAAVARVDGEPWNLKITTPADLEFARRLDPGAHPMRERRVGLGHDLHRLEAGGPLKLGGIDLPGDVHAVAHSDGDALLHAVTDAVLGACALGDLGQRFPDTAPEHRGRDSADFLKEALQLARAAGFAPVQADVVVRLERPRLAPHRERLVARLAQLLGLPAADVSIKAKTAEGLDAVGEGRAVACDALVQMERTTS